MPAFGFNFEMPPRLFWWVYVASAIATTGGVCIFAILKSAMQAHCASDNNASQAITASLAWGATAVVANAAFLVFRSRAKQGFALVAAICAK